MAVPLGLTLEDRMFDIEKRQQSDAQYMADLRAALLKLGVTPDRCKRLYGLPLTASQVAFAIRQYIIGIERREKAAQQSVQTELPTARKTGKSKSKRQPA